MVWVSVQVVRAAGCQERSTHAPELADVKLLVLGREEERNDFGAELHKVLRQPSQAIVSDASPHNDAKPAQTLMRSDVRSMSVTCSGPGKRLYIPAFFLRGVRRCEGL